MFPLLQDTVNRGTGKELDGRVGNLGADVLRVNLLLGPTAGSGSLGSLLPRLVVRPEVSVGCRGLPLRLPRGVA